MQTHDDLIIVGYEPSGQGLGVKPVFKTAAEIAAMNAQRAETAKVVRNAILRARHPLPKPKPARKAWQISARQGILKRANRFIQLGCRFMPRQLSDDILKTGVFLTNSDGLKLHITFAKNILVPDGNVLVKEIPAPGKKDPWHGKEWVMRGKRLVMPS